MQEMHVTKDVMRFRANGTKGVHYKPIFRFVLTIFHLEQAHLESRGPALGDPFVGVAFRYASERERALL